MSALVLCTSTRHTGVHLLAQADTQEFYSSHLHFPKHQTHRSSTPRTVHVCISLLCTHSFFRDVYSCLSLRWATARLGHPLKAKGKDWIERNPDDRLAQAIDLTSAEAAERATPAINHFERAMHMASCLGLGNNAGVPQPPAHPPPITAPTGFRFTQGTGFTPGAGRGIVVTPPGVFGRGIMPFGNTTPAAASSFSMLQQGILIGGLLHQQDTMQAEMNDIRNLAGRVREQLGRFPI